MIVLLIHSANPKSRPVGIIVFAHVVRPSVRPSDRSHFSNLENKTKFATCVTMGLAEWIIDDNCLVCDIFKQILKFFKILLQYNLTPNDVLSLEITCKWHEQIYPNFSRLKDFEEFVRKCFGSICWQEKSIRTRLNQRGFFAHKKNPFIFSWTIVHWMRKRTTKKLFSSVHLIHSANPQPRSVGIIVFAHIVRPSVRFHFSKSSKTKQQKTMSATGESVGLAQWIIDDTCLVFPVSSWRKNAEIGLNIDLILKLRL